MMLIQDSLDGKAWREVPAAGQFKNKKDLKEWFRLFEEANSLDWRVGFLIRCRDGRFFRAVHKNGKEVRY